MIFSRSRKFIFIKTRKTAGTSLEIALSACCSNGDVITPISPEDEVFRLASGGLLPACFMHDLRGEGAYRAAIRRRNLVEIDSARPAQERCRFWNHMLARDVRTEVGDDDWSHCFRFAFDRHPYEKAVSGAYFLGRGEQKRFDEMIELVITNGVCRNWNLYTENNELIVDRIYRYEDMSSALAEIELKIGVKFASSMPRAKGQYRMDHRAAASILTVSQRNRIFEICGEEFEYHGYEQ